MTFVTHVCVVCVCVRVLCVCVHCVLCTCMAVVYCVVMANQDRYMCVQPGEAETGIRRGHDKVTFSLMHVMYIHPCEIIFTEEQWGNYKNNHKIN